MYKPNRQSIRLKDFDYDTGGVFFITICVHERRSLFGKISNGNMELNPIGQMVNDVWQHMPEHNSGLLLDNYIVMPNHFHALIGLHKAINFIRTANFDETMNTQTRNNPNAITLSGIVRKFKTVTMNKYKLGVLNDNWQPYNCHLWQRNYWDHIIRSDHDLGRCREYIANNPLKWHFDKLHPDH